MSPKKRNLFVLGIFLMLFGAGVLFFVPLLPEEKVHHRKVAIAVSQTPLSAPFFIADKLGYFEQFGLDVSLVPCNGGVDCNQKLLDREVNYATASESVLMFQSFKRQDISLLVSFAESDNDLKLLTLAPSNIRSVQALQGRKVGVVKGSASEFYFDSVLIANNLKDLALEKVYLAPDELVPSLLSYRVDAISSWEPLGYKADVLSAAKVVNLGSSAIYQLSFNLLAMKPYLERSHDESLQLLKALDLAVEWINSHPNQALETVAMSLSLSVDQIAWSWNDLVFRLALGNSLYSNIQLQARWAIESGLVDSEPPNFREVFYPYPFKQLIASRE